MWFNLILCQILCDPSSSYSTSRIHTHPYAIIYLSYLTRLLHLVANDCCILPPFFDFWLRMSLRFWMRSTGMVWTVRLTLLEASLLGFRIGVNSKTRKFYPNSCQPYYYHINTLESNSSIFSFSLLPFPLLCLHLSSVVGLDVWSWSGWGSLGLRQPKIWVATIMVLLLRRLGLKWSQQL